MTISNAPPARVAEELSKIRTMTPKEIGECGTAVSLWIERAVTLLAGPADLPAVLEDYLAAGQAAVDLMRNDVDGLGGPGGEFTEAAEKLADALQMMRFAAIWQSQPPTLRGMTTAEIAFALQGGTMVFESPPCMNMAPVARRDHLPVDAFTARGASPTEWPEGYGRLIPASGDRPDWIVDDEIVARHLPMGLSERKAKGVVTWIHPFRVRADHPFYAAGKPSGGVETDDMDETEFQRFAGGKGDE